jgi:hypothetical protein
MYRGRLTPDTPLPAQVQLPIPASAGNPHAVAKRTADGRLLTLPFEREVKGAWATIALTTDVPEVQVEAYLPITMDGASRRFGFEWPGGVAVDELRYEVQRPVGASDVRISPPPSNEAQQSDHLTYYYGSLGPLLAAQRGILEVRYTKSDSQLSAQAAPQADSAPMGMAAPPPAMPPEGELSQEPAARPGPTNAALWFVSGGLVVGVILGIAWWTQSMRRAPQKP